jgi:hypothetical protein
MPMKTVSKEDLLDLLLDFDLEVTYKTMEGSEQVLNLQKGSLIPETSQFLNNIIMVKTMHK